MASPATPFWIRLSKAALYLGFAGLGRAGDTQIMLPVRGLIIPGLPQRQKTHEEYYLKPTLSLTAQSKLLCNREPLGQDHPRSLPIIVSHGFSLTLQLYLFCGQAMARSPQELTRTSSSPLPGKQGRALFWRFAFKAHSCLNVYVTWSKTAIRKPVRPATCSFLDTKQCYI